MAAAKTGAAADAAEKTADDEESHEEVADEDDDDDDGCADGWFKYMGGKIRRRVLVEGTGPQPELNQDVLCSVSLALAGDSSSDVLQRWESRRYRIGESEAAPMLELALRYMREGEEAEVFGAASMAWGAAGLRAATSEEREIPPDSDILARVTLRQCLNAQEGEDGMLTWDEKVSQMAWRKENGSDHFRRRHFDAAKRCYGKGLELFADGVLEPPAEVAGGPEEAIAAVTRSLSELHSNLAAVHLEQGDNVSARDAALASLDRNAENPKALFRLARAELLLGDFRSCETALRRAQKLNAEDPALRRLAAELRRARESYAEKSRAMASRVLEVDWTAAKSSSAGSAPPPPAASSGEAKEERTPEALDAELEELLRPPTYPAWSRPWLQQRFAESPWLAVALVALLFQLVFAMVGRGSSER
eukprot:TRINITY_DN2015_c0_g4_i1.p1 TRINITY_DN2015_c0_g4~~TRINITY_DN2015_c0_g4_i1.p1  ORF type:complete len:447 (+),score=119.36 TRINITY_DN2015_c0_g4_i1:84-1343(+)